MNDHESFLDELQRDIDQAHREIDRAGAPPENLWHRVRARAQPPMEEISDMSASTLPLESPRTPEITPRVPGSSLANHREIQRTRRLYAGVGERTPTTSRGFSHYLNIASTVALVAAIALGGWFTMMQLNSSGGSGGVFGLFGQSDDSATCDVEPMTVDEVMAIVENPYRYMDEDDYPNPIGSSSHETPWEDDYQEVQPRLPASLNTGLDTEPTQPAFDQASVVIDEYLECMRADGSVAMMLRFSDPISIQHHIRMEFPFYRTEEQVRAYVTEWLESGEPFHAITYERNGEMLTYRPAQDKSMAGTQIHDFGLGFDQVIYVGSEIYDEDGDFIGNFSPTLYMTYNVDQEYLDHGVVFTLLHSRYTGEWYVVTEGWMNLNSVI